MEVDTQGAGGRESEVRLGPTVRLIGSGPVWSADDVGVAPGKTGAAALFLSLLFHLRPEQADAPVVVGRPVLNKAYDAVFAEPKPTHGRNDAKYLKPVKKAGMLKAGSVLGLGVDDVDLWSVELRSQELLDLCKKPWATIEDADCARTAWERLDRMLRMAPGEGTIEYGKLPAHPDDGYPHLQSIIRSRLTDALRLYVHAQKVFLRAALELNRGAIDEWLAQGPPGAWGAAQRFLDGEV